MLMGPNLTETSFPAFQQILLVTKQSFYPFFYGAIDLSILLISLGASGLLLLCSSVLMPRLGVLRDEMA